MKLKILSILGLILFAGGALGQDLCINWLPAKLCPYECFELDVCHDTAGPGYIYDSIYIFSELEDENPETSPSGTTFVLEGATPDMPFICNYAYFDTITHDTWIFGWDSVYICAFLGGSIVADTSLLLFHYPPDSAFVGVNGIGICPESVGTLFGKWLEVRGAFFWSFVGGTLEVLNDFSHRNVIDTIVCIMPDHQAYEAPDSLSPWIIDTLYDPCPTPLCTTFYLLPDDVVDDEYFTLCPGVCETLVLQTYYPYEHCLIGASGTLFCRSDTTIHDSLGYVADTFEYCASECGTSFVYYFVDGLCSTIAIDSFVVVVPCITYEMLVDGSLPHDTGDAFCPGETLTLCLGGELCEEIDSSDICWDLPGTHECAFCINYIADTSFTAYLNFIDCSGCEYSDSIEISVSPIAHYTLDYSGGCSGSPIWFTVSPDSGDTIESVLFEFGDGSDEFIDTVDSAGNFVAVNIYGDNGQYMAHATITTQSGCQSRDSILVRQVTVTAELDADPLPVCLGATVNLDASGSSVEPAGILIYKFFDPEGDTVYIGELSYTTDTVEIPGVYTVWAVDTLASCSSYAAINVPAIWVDISVPETIWTIEGCPRCIELGYVPYNCESDVSFGYRMADTLGEWSDIVPLLSSQFCTYPFSDTSYYRIFAWCDDCPDGKDSAETAVLPIQISAFVSDSIICFGDLMPNLLITDSIHILPSSIADSILCQVIFTWDTGEDTVWDWSSISALPAEVFPGYPVQFDGMLTYRFALWGATDCAYEAVGRITMRHPVALLRIDPNDTICEIMPFSLDARESFSNCTGASLLYKYFQVIDEYFWPLSSDTVDSIISPDLALMPGIYTFAVVVFMEDVPWCCDTAYTELLVCDIERPELIIDGECAPGTLMAGQEAIFHVINPDEYNHFCWGIGDSLPPLCFGVDSTFLYTPEAGGTLYINLCVYTCDTACKYCRQDTFWVDEPPTCYSPWDTTAMEDDCSTMFDLSSRIVDSDGDGWWTELVSGPDSVIVSESGTLTWNCPTNCHVGEQSILITVHDSSVCAAVCTIDVHLTVQNAFDGIIGIDTLFGSSCVEDSFVSTSATLGTLFMDNPGVDCHDISLELDADDEGYCDCGYWTAEILSWLEINDISGVIAADVSDVPRGNYEDTIFYSDCFAIDTIITLISVPNHSPIILTVPHEIWMISGTETSAVSLSDFDDVDGDTLDWLDYSITNSDSFGLTALGDELILQAGAAYQNFPGNPDTLQVTVTDGELDATAYILVWVSETSIRHTQRKPTKTALVGAYPNPFNTSVWIEAEFDKATYARLSIYDASGRRVKKLFDGELPASVLRFSWDGLDGNAVIVPSGRYVAVLDTDIGRSMQNLILTR